MPIRAGGKMRGTHTTFSDLAAEVVDLAHRIPEIVGISAGVLQSGKGFAGGSQKVKIGDFKGGVILTVRQSRSVQEIRLYVTCEQAAKLAIAKALRNANIPITFRRD
jgi:hypothetical protein